MSGVTFYDQGDECETFDLILSGSLVTYSLAENGSQMMMFEFSRGHTLGANLLFGDTHTYPFSVYCQERAEIIHLTKDAVMTLLYNYDFTLNFVGIVSSNSQKLNQKIYMTMHRTLRENLLDFFQQQAHLQKTNYFRLPISKKQLADQMGVQRPSLFRELKRLKEDGVIEVENRYIHLKKTL